MNNYDYDEEQPTGAIAFIAIGSCILSVLTFIGFLSYIVYH